MLALTRVVVAVCVCVCVCVCYPHHTVSLGPNESLGVKLCVSVLSKHLTDSGSHLLPSHRTDRALLREPWSDSRHVDLLKPAKKVETAQ
jgi:hypothetical protein